MYPFEKVTEDNQVETSEKGGEEAQDMLINNISVKKALRINGVAANDAILKEFRNLCFDMKAPNPFKRGNLTAEQ